MPLTSALYLHKPAAASCREATWPGGRNQQDDKSFSITIEQDGHRVRRTHGTHADHKGWDIEPVTRSLPEQHSDWAHKLKQFFKYGSNNQAYNNNDDDDDDDDDDHGGGGVGRTEMSINCFLNNYTKKGEDQGDVGVRKVKKKVLRRTNAKRWSDADVLGGGVDEN